MYLKVRYYYQRIIKKHIDASLMRRKVRSRKKRSLMKMLSPQIHNDMQLDAMQTPPNYIRHEDDILVMPLIEYATLWNDAAKVKPADFLRGMPTIRALEFIIALQNKVIYAFSDVKTQTRMIAYLSGLFGPSEATTIRHYILERRLHNQAVTLIDNKSCLLFYLLALQNYDSTDRALTDDDKRNVFKAYLYCSHVWLEQQQRNIKGLNLTDLSILIDIPVVEFKSPKDFKTQLYKATRFFDFSNQNAHFGQFAQWFLADKGIPNASEYLGRIFHLFSHTAKDPTPVYIQVSANQVADVAFFDQYVINPADCNQVWDNQDINYLRNHFLIKIQDATTGDLKLMILNVNLLVDKLYQGMMFDMSESVLKRGGGNYKGKPFLNKGDFNGFMGEEFSEHQIFYDTMEMAYPQNEVVKVKGSFLKANKIQGEPDYCLIDGERLFMFEYKDIMMKDETKQSSDLALIKETIFDRVCKYEKGRKKGIGQMLFNVNRIFNQGLLDRFGVDVSNVKEVYLVVVTTDTAYNALGVNALVRDQYSKIKDNLDFAVSVKLIEPVIIDFESLFSLIIPLREKRFELSKLICQYLDKTKKGSRRMMPFYGYLKDYSPVPLLKEKDVPLLFSGFLDMIKNELSQSN